MCFLAYKGSKSLYKDTVGQKLDFTHFQAEDFENPMSKNNFQRIHGFECVSNMSQMIKIIILYGFYSHSEAYGSLWSELKKLHKTPLKTEIPIL